MAYRMVQWSVSLSRIVHVPSHNIVHQCVQRCPKCKAPICNDPRAFVQAAFLSVGKLCVQQAATHTKGW